MSNEELYQIGVITQTHGIKGEVKVFPMTDDIARFNGAKGVILRAAKEDIVVDIERARPQKNLVIIKFKDIDDINDVERYKGCGLFVTESDRVSLSDDEYFASDLIGIEVVSDEGDKVGELIDVLFTGANDVYVVRCSDDFGNGTKAGKEILIPAIRDVVKEVDITSNTMTVHLLKGLVEP